MKERNDLLADGGGMKAKRSRGRHSRASLARRGGAAFFFVLNDHCDRNALLRQLDEFERAGLEGLVLHPRDGLLVPYAGSAWFDLVGWIVEECERRGIEPILYDEDPYPSGNASGRIAAEHPELAGCAIERFSPPTVLRENELFVFPTGRLCWAGIVFPEDPERTPVDLTDAVGMIRREWEKAEWDSRWYYPITPVYSCPRSFAHHAEFALLCPGLPPGGRLVAFVARPIKSGSEWGTLADTLNPEATRLFLQYTHERYERTLGKRFGQGCIKSIFTDEAKPPAAYSWTPGLFESFRQCYGYDLRPKLELLLGEGCSPDGMKVRLDYREWIRRRFEKAWLEPISRWCARRGVDLIGHHSPEEDPVNQSATIGNLFPLQKQLALSGFDLIIPAIGDSRHPLLNVAIVAAASSAQQNRQPGVCCESLGAFGPEADVGTAARCLAWQAVHGITFAVLHGAFHSSVGLRRCEAPPDYGPDSPVWTDMEVIHREMIPFLRAAVGAAQEAPVAVLWPIASFQAQGMLWDGNEGGMRGDLLELMQSCLENQVGLHFLDEADLVKGSVREGNLHLGRAKYRWVLIPSLTVLSEKSFLFLERLKRDGVRVESVGEPPAWVRLEDASLKLLMKQGWECLSLQQFREERLPMLPRALEIPPPLRLEFRATVWQRRSRRHLMLMHLGLPGTAPRRLEISGREFAFEPGDLAWFKESRGRWVLHRRFSPSQFPAAPPEPAKVHFSEWEMELPGQPPIRSAHPLAAWQLTPAAGPEPVAMILTAPVNIGGGKVTEKIVYRVEAAIPLSVSTVFLYVEPTLMRGRFTLESGCASWEFAVTDTDTEVHRIELPVTSPGRLPLSFTLHEPTATDGIKTTPKLELLD